jgi:hypothetical protein
MEAFLLTRMTRHGCRPWEAYLLPFLCQGRALVEVKVAQTPFGIFPPLIRVNPTPKVRRGEVLSWGVGRGETHARGVRRGRTLSRGVRRAGHLLCWAGLGRSCAHDYLRWPRPMSFDSYLMGTVLLVPDKIYIKIYEYL